MTTHKISLILTNGSYQKAEADFYSSSEAFPSAPAKYRTILYFHGGGLLFGSRKDLPEVYRDMFLKAGYDFLAFDYPLAPEYPVSMIAVSCMQFVQWFLTHYPDELGLSSPEYILFGRSAGAFLSIQTAYQMVRNRLPAPDALILFYGYPSLLEEDFSKPNRYYQAEYPPVSKEEAFQSIENSPVFDTVKSPRTLLYLYARQTGGWMELLGPEEDLEDSSLSSKQLSILPPAFLTASSMDRDVPFRLSKNMARSIPDSKFYPVYNLGHDFDQDTSAPEGRQAYEECLEWLEQL